MTETNIKPTCHPGRLKKKGNKQTKCMENNPFHCSACDCIYHMASKSKHF